MSRRTSSVSLSIVVTWDRPRGLSNPPWKCVKRSPICKSFEEPSISVARASTHGATMLAGMATGLWTDFWARL
ncbi:hypothetical protein BC826DRAFT_1040176 [Russula brevipes]|nr:hypothetical protein BC826DRAFT_1040176 [Russula brevipes]